MGAEIVSTHVVIPAMCACVHVRAVMCVYVCMKNHVHSILCCIYIGCWEW